MGPIPGPRVASPLNPGCELVVDFGGPSVVMHRSAKVPANADFYGLMRQSGNNQAFGYNCTCIPETDFGKVTAALAETDYAQTVFEMGGTVVSASFADSPFGGKLFRAESLVPTLYGEMTLRTHAYYFRQCGVMVTTTELTRSILQTGAESAQFLASVRRAGSLAPGTTPAGQSDVAERLRRLDDLRARGLISPAEYETRRKAIIDSL